MYIHLKLPQMDECSHTGLCSSAVQAEAGSFIWSLGGLFRSDMISMSFTCNLRIVWRFPLAFRMSTAILTFYLFTHQPLSFLKCWICIVYLDLFLLQHINAAGTNLVSTKSKALGDTEDILSFCGKSWYLTSLGLQSVQ